MTDCVSNNYNEDIPVNIRDSFKTESIVGPVEIRVIFDKSNEIAFATKLNHYQLTMTDPSYIPCWVWGDPCEELKIGQLNIGINMFEVTNIICDICASWIKATKPNTFSFRTKNSKLQKIYMRMYRRLRGKSGLNYDMYQVDDVFWFYKICQ